MNSESPSKMRGPCGGGDWRRIVVVCDDIGAGRVYASTLPLRFDRSIVVRAASARDLRRARTGAARAPRFHARSMHRYALRRIVALRGSNGRGGEILGNDGDKSGVFPSSYAIAASL
ncbi:MAG: hypothetical protein HY286_02900 [Planctomycetes bacterium]|nr:hypothetical protein [Planctomycetota bacterium]